MAKQVVIVDEAAAALAREKAAVLVSELFKEVDVDGSGALDEGCFADTFPGHGAGSLRRCDAPPFFETAAGYAKRCVAQS